MRANLNFNEVITTARLPVDTRNKLLALASLKKKTKSEIIIESLEMYYKQEEGEIDSFTLGEPFFGRYGSGESDRATTYKQRIKKKLSHRMSEC
jgi:predicted DNA-binding protein